MFLTVNKEKVAAQKEGGQFISESGIYPLTIKNASVEKTKNGATQITFGFEDENGNGLTVYGLTVTDTEGNPVFGMDILMSLAVVAGLEGLSEPVERTIKVGADKTDKEVLVLEDLDDVEVLVKLQKEYGRYNGKITEKFLVRKFYNVDTKQTGTELAADKEAVQYEKDLKYADKDSYKNQVTEEEVTKYKSNKSGVKPSVTPEVKANPFAKKA